jgi:hypothetical protein
LIVTLLEKAASTANFGFKVTTTDTKLYEKMPTGLVKLKARGGSSTFWVLLQEDLSVKKLTGNWQKKT